MWCCCCDVCVSLWWCDLIWCHIMVWSNIWSHHHWLIPLYFTLLGGAGDIISSFIGWLVTSNGYLGLILDGKWLILCNLVEMENIYFVWYCTIYIYSTVLYAGLAVLISLGMILLSMVNSFFETRTLVIALTLVKIALYYEYSCAVIQWILFYSQHIHSRYIGLHYTLSTLITEDVAVSCCCVDPAIEVQFSHLYTIDYTYYYHARRTLSMQCMRTVNSECQFKHSFPSQKLIIQLVSFSQQVQWYCYRYT